MTTVVVTGASGHIGNNLVRTLLGQGRKVRALVHGNDNRGLEGLDGLEQVQGDVTDAASLQRAFSGAEVVYHLAAFISIHAGEDHNTLPVNAEGTKNVVATCQREGIRRLVHFSSVHALWGHPRERPIDETQELADRPDALPYDRSKALGEKAVLAGVQNGLDAVIVNPGAVIGPNDYRPSAQGAFLMDLYNRKLPALIAGGYSWVDVRDVVEGALAAEQRGRRGERYLLTGHPLSLRDLALAIERVTGSKAPRMVTPLWVAALMAPGAELVSNLRKKRPKFSRHSVQIVGGNYQFVHDKARRELGYSPRPIETTIADTFSWYRSAGYL